MTSIIEKLAASFTDTTLPKLYRDPVLDIGSKYLFDFTNSYCNANADGVLAGGASFTNLVDGAAQASAAVSGTGSGNLTSVTGKKGLQITAATPNGVLLGATSSIYDRSVLNHEFLFIMWMKIPTTGYSTSYPSLIFQGIGGNRTNEQFYIDMGSGGASPTLTLSNPSGAQSQGSVTLTPGAVAQMAFHWNPGVSVDSYLNGALVSSNTSGVVSTLHSASQALQITPNTFGTIYRVYEEDMYVTKQSLPLVTPAQLVAADYALWAGTFT